jgi:hypothetical protein
MVNFEVLELFAKLFSKKKRLGTFLNTLGKSSVSVQAWKVNKVTQF